jgi:ABC-type transport system substrate-binding protein
VFSRNVDYFRDRPNLDGFKVEIGQEPLVAILRLQKGEVDIAGDGIPPAKYLEIKNSPDDEDLIVDREQFETSYITINTTKKLLDDVRVRKAINMAINKDRIVRIINCRATPANQVLPPLMPGYDRAYKGYPYDVEGAKKLMEEAGLKDGFSTTLYAMNTDPNPRIAQAIQQDLAAIGIKAEIKGAGAAGGHRRRRQQGSGHPDLVGRHGLDRRLPRPVRFLRADFRLRASSPRRMELVVVLRQGLRGSRDQGRRHLEARAEG